MAAWIYLILAGLLEVGWTYGLKYSEGFTVLLPSVITIILIVISFILLARVMRLIDIGTAYAIFTGIGTVGTVIIGILVLGEPTDPLRLFFIALLIAGIVGLKLVSGDDGKPQEAEIAGNDYTVIETASRKDRS
ncbi:MAG: multidrug efflux SMR transporter [Candidatus Pristimantibacillus sp.]